MALTLGQSGSARKSRIPNRTPFDGRRLRREAFERAVKRPGISANERKVAEYLAPLLELGPRPISNRQIRHGAGVYKDGCTRGLRRAIEHGFFARDETTRPHTYRLCDEWLTEAA